MVNIFKNEKLANHVTFKIGGDANMFAIASTLEQLKYLLSYCKHNKIPFCILGSGSNVLVSDIGFRGLVIQNRTNNFLIEEDAETVKLTTDSGVILDDLTSYLINEGWSGFEWAVGIPGSIGAAIITNAGTTSGNISNVLSHITIINEEGTVEIRTKEQLKLGYRDSIYKKEWDLRTKEVIISAQFHIKRGDKETLLQTLTSRKERRKKREPVEPNIGSIFKNPTNGKVREMIESIGLKGFRIGNAQISEVAPSFIINLGNASSDDVLKLIYLMKEKVHEHYGIKLIPEVEFIGEWSQKSLGKIKYIHS